MLSGHSSPKGLPKGKYPSWRTISRRHSREISEHMTPACVRPPRLRKQAEEPVDKRAAAFRDVDNFLAMSLLDAILTPGLRPQPPAAREEHWVYLPSNSNGKYTQ